MVWCLPRISSLPPSSIIFLRRHPIPPGTTLFFCVDTSPGFLCGFPCNHVGVATPVCWFERRCRSHFFWCSPGVLASSIGLPPRAFVPRPLGSAFKFQVRAPPRVFYMSPAPVFGLCWGPPGVLPLPPVFSRVPPPEASSWGSLLGSLPGPRFSCPSVLRPSVVPSGLLAPSYALSALRHSPCLPDLLDRPWSRPDPC